MARKPGEREDDRQWRQASLALTLPLMMVVGPLLGFFLASGLVYWLEIGPPWAARIRAIGVFLGIMTGIRETILVIRKLSRES
jgi:hypothetical protein